MLFFQPFILGPPCFLSSSPIPPRYSNDNDGILGSPQHRISVSRRLAFLFVSKREATLFYTKISEIILFVAFVAIFILLFYGVHHHSMNHSSFCTLSINWADDSNADSLDMKWAFRGRHTRSCWSEFKWKCELVFLPSNDLFGYLIIIFHWITLSLC